MSPNADRARFLAAYAKRYNAGAFGAPTASDLDTGAHGILDDGADTDRVVIVHRTLTRASIRHDFTGAAYTLPAGTRIVTHLAAGPTATLPDLSAFDYVYAQIEDRNVTTQLTAQGRTAHAVRVSATAQIIGCYGHGPAPRLYHPADVATFVRLDLPPLPLDEARNDLANITGWHDDFPYYSDGTWTAVSLRGYRPDDPQWGVKPSEMPRKWRDEHPDALNLTCGWTSAADLTPNLRQWVEDLPHIGPLERVRLFRMEPHPTRNGRLARHSDIQDTSVGTRDGDLIRIHVPIRTHPEITMTCWNLDGQPRTAHLAAGSAYYLDTRKPHAVHNPTDTDRVHLVIDCEATPAARTLIIGGHPQ